MKKYLYLFLVFITLISCQKNDQEDSLISNSKRPHIVSYFENGNILNKMEYKYVGDQIASVHDITPIADSSYYSGFKYEFDYRLPVLTLSLHTSYNGHWTHFSDITYSYTNARLDQIDIYGGELGIGQIIESQVFSYDNNRLVLTIIEKDFGDGMKMTGKRDYAYENQKLKRCNYYSHSNSEDWWVHRYQSYIYSENHVEVSTIRQADSLYFDKITHTFDNNQLVYSEYLSRNIHDELEYWQEVFYTYDTDGYLIEEKTEKDDDTFITTIEYELGKDNLDLFNSPENQIYEFWNPFNFQFDK